MHRKPFWTLGLLAAIVAVGWTVEANAQCGSRGPWAAQACAAPGYGDAALGCCDQRARCECENVWEGYCEERCCGCGQGWLFCWPTMHFPVATPYAAPACDPTAQSVIETKTTVASRQMGQVILLPPVEPRR